MITCRVMASFTVLPLYKSERQTFVEREVKASSAKPNGNAVSLEAEMVKGASIRQDHQMALSVYSKAIEILRLSAGRR